MNISDWNKRVKKGKREAPKVEELTFKAISIWFQNQLHSIRQHCPRCVCTCVCIYPSVQFSCWVMSDSLWPHGLQYTRLPYQSPSTRACSNSCPLSRWCHPPFHPLLFPSPSTLNLFQHQSLFQWVSYSHLVAKILEFQLQHQSFQWVFRTDFL